MKLTWLVCSIALAATVWQPRSGEVLSPELKAVRKLEVGKCAKCHRRYQPSAYTQSDWDAWMDRMSRKSKLKPDQTELLKRYPDLLRQESGSQTAPPGKRERK